MASNITKKLRPIDFNPATDVDALNMYFLQLFDIVIMSNLNKDSKISYSFNDFVGNPDSIQPGQNIQKLIQQFDPDALKHDNFVLHYFYRVITATKSLAKYCRLYSEVVNHLYDTFAADFRRVTPQIVSTDLEEKFIEAIWSWADNSRPLQSSALHTTSYRDRSTEKMLNNVLHYAKTLAKEHASWEGKIKETLLKFSNENKGDKIMLAKLLLSFEFFRPDVKQSTGSFCYMEPDDYARVFGESNWNERPDLNAYNLVKDELEKDELPSGIAYPSRKIIDTCMKMMVCLLGKFFCQVPAESQRIFATIGMSEKKDRKQVMVEGYEIYDRFPPCLSVCNVPEHYYSVPLCDEEAKRRCLGKKVHGVWDILFSSIGLVLQVAALGAVIFFIFMFLKEMFIRTIS